MIMMTTDGQTDYFIPRACMQGNNDSLVSNLVRNTLGDKIQQHAHKPQSDNMKFCGLVMGFTKKITAYTCKYAHIDISCVYMYIMLPMTPSYGLHSSCRH